MLRVTIFCDKFHGNFFVEKITNFAGNFLLKVAESPGCVRGLIRLHLSYCTMRTMFWLKELNFFLFQSVLQRCVVVRPGRHWWRIFTVKAVKCWSSSDTTSIREFIKPWLSWFTSSSTIWTTYCQGEMPWTGGPLIGGTGTNWASWAWTIWLGSSLTTTLAAIFDTCTCNASSKTS